MTDIKYHILKQRLVTIIETALFRYEQVICHSGLALGADTIWSMAILQLKIKYPTRVLFHAEIPMMTQSNKWSKHSRQYWQYQIDNADFTSLYCNNIEEQINKNPKQEKAIAAYYLNLRNEGMIDHSDILIGIYNGSPGGTGNAIQYALKTNTKIYLIKPERN